MQSRCCKLTLLKLISGLLIAVTCNEFNGQTTTVHVRVLNGRTGHPISGKELWFVDHDTGVNGERRDDLDGGMIVKTVVDGDLYVATPDSLGVLVFNVMDRYSWWTPCSKQSFYDSNTHKYGNDYLYSVQTINTSGLVAKNDCSKVSATAKPGELVVFIRPTTWWERFVAGVKS